MVAQIIEVNTLSDVVNNGDGLTSLREAISDAASGDTITFANSLNGGTITLNGSALNITQSLIIDGDINNDDTPSITINGGGNSRIFNIDNSTSVINVTLNELNLTNGATTDNGGAILSKENLTINNSRISNNSASDGGGLYADGGSVNISGSTFSQNTASSEGGGIYVVDIDTNITSSSLVSNTASEGGGVYSDTDLTTKETIITNSTISSNTGSTGGGGIRNYDGNVSIYNPHSAAPQMK